MNPYILLAVIWFCVAALADHYAANAPTIFAGGIAASVPVALFLAARLQSRRQVTLDLFKEYYSVDFAESRTKAARFMKKHRGVNWSVNDPYVLGEGDEDLAGYGAVVRFFHRFSILYELNEINRRLAGDLFSREVAFWQGRLFEPMSNREGMFVKESVAALVRGISISAGGSRFEEGYAASKRLKPPELAQPHPETRKSMKERWGSL